MTIKIFLLFLTCMVLSACAHKRESSENYQESDSLVAIEVVEEYPENEANVETSNATDTEAESKKESVRKFLLDMYATVLPAVEKNNGDRYISKYFGEDLLDWYRMVDKYDRTHNEGEIGCFNCELWTQCQDPDANIKATVESVRFDTDYMDNEYAVARVRLKGKYNPPTFIEVKLVQDGSQWVIFDYAGIAYKMKFYMADRPE